MLAVKTVVECCVASSYVKMKKMDETDTQVGLEKKLQTELVLTVFC